MDKPKRRPGQFTFHFRSDVQPLYQQFKSQFLDVSDTQIVNAALRYYLPVAIQKGVDGNLKPLGAPLTDDTREALRELLDERLSRFQAPDEDGELPRLSLVVNNDGS